MQCVAMQEKRSKLSGNRHGELLIVKVFKPSELFTSCDTVLPWQEAHAVS